MELKDDKKHRILPQSIFGRENGRFPSSAGSYSDFTELFPRR
jgi:hypothetical protein